MLAALLSLEINYNEILGGEQTPIIYPYIFQMMMIFYRNKHRSVSQDQVQKYNPKIIEINSFVTRTRKTPLSCSPLVDWISWFLSELNNVDSIEIDVINYLKSELSKIN